MSINNIAKMLGVEHNVSIRVIDEATGKVVKCHQGHNAATNTLIEGIAHYLTGDGVLNQGYAMLNNYIPQYISLGTMGLSSQEADELGLPAGIGIDGDTEEDRFIDYMKHCPGYGADGYDPVINNDRLYLGLGPSFEDRPTAQTVNCELISSSFSRSMITYRDIVPEANSELPETIDVVFSAFISTGALASFRESDKDYVFITEAGLWSSSQWSGSRANGLLAGYRIVPPDKNNWDMAVPENREILKKNIIKVSKNQIVQVIWKIQLGGLHQLGGEEFMPPSDSSLHWIVR